MRNKDTNNQGTNVTPENGVVKKKSKKKLFIILGVVLVLIIAIGSCSRTGSKSDSKDDSSKSSFKESFEEGFEAGLSGTKAADSEESEESKEESVEVSEESENVEDSEESTDENTVEPVVSEGSYRVGEDVPAGDYLIYADENMGIDTGSHFASGGEFEVRESTSADADLVLYDGVDTFAFVTITDGQYLKLDKCSLYPIDYTNKIDTTKEGGFRVGVDIPAGEYKVVEDDDDDEVLSYPLISVYSSYASMIDLVTCQEVSGSGYIEVQAGQYLVLDDCHIEQ